MNKSIILLVGSPGSGKSTYAKKYEALGYVRVSADKDGKLHKQIFNKAVQNRENIIVDKMNFNKAVRNDWLKAAKEANYHTTIIVLHENYETCLQRCLLRKGHETIKTEKAAKDALHFFFTKYERVSDDEADVVIRLGWENKAKQCIYSDLDGTLANVDHRLQYVRGKKPNWNKFFEELINDIPNHFCVEIINSVLSIMDNNEYVYDLVYASGRPNKYRTLTKQWLYKVFHGKNYNHLFMRFDKDYRKDSVVKEIILDFEIKTRYQILFALDDRQQVVDMLRSHGIRVLQVDYGNF